jgi:hypothetical protein
LPNSNINQGSIIPSVENIGKFLAIFVSIVGVYAWLGGQSYNLGFWREVGWEGSIIKPSLQETAFNGFIGPFYSWWGAVAFLVALGSFGLLVEWWTSRTARRTNESGSSANEGLVRRRRMDPDALKFFGGSIFGAIFFAAVVVVPLSVWVVSGMKAGRDAAISAICAARAAPYFPSNLTLADGKILNGRFIERSKNSAF